MKNDSLRYYVKMLAAGAVFTASLAAPLGASAQSNIAADWQARSTASGVLSSNTFDYSTVAELKAGSNGTFTSNPPANDIGLEPTINLSGRNSLKVITNAGAAGNGGAWQDWLDGTTGNRYTKFYIQFAVYFPRETLAYRYQGTNGQLKILNIERYGGGQVTVTNPMFLGFPGIMVNGLTGVRRAFSSGQHPVPNVSTEYIVQPAIDMGTPANPSTACEFWSRYGAARGIMVNEDYGDTGNAYLDQRNLTNGFHNNCAKSAGVPYAMNDWTVIEVHIDTSNSDPSVNTIKAWAARYGQVPRMIVNEVGTAEVNRNDEYYRRFELMNYDTPRIAESGRPTFYTYFDEVIVSTQPINFPGGHSLPDSSVVKRPQPPSSVRAQ